MTRERPYITCRQLIARIDDYMDGTLDAIDREDFERHLLLCPSCQSYLQSYRKTIELIRLLAVEDPSCVSGATNAPPSLGGRARRASS